MRIELKNRRWYDWVLIGLGTIGVALQSMFVFSPAGGEFKWLHLIVSLAFVWFGTVPRKPKA